RLRTMGAGTVVGELGLYLGCSASAAVVADRPSTLYHLSLDAFTQLEQTDPEVATALHKCMVRLVGARLANHNKTLQALLEEAEEVAQVSEVHLPPSHDPGAARAPA